MGNFKRIAINAAFAAAFVCLTAVVTSAQSGVIRNAQLVGRNTYSIYVGGVYPTDASVLDQLFRRTAQETCRGSYTILEQTHTSDQMIGVIQCQAQGPLPQQQSFQPQSLPQQVPAPPISSPRSSQSFPQSSTTTHKPGLRFGGGGCYSNFSGFGVEGQLALSLDQLMSGLEMLSTFNYFFPDGFDYFEGNVNLIYSFDRMTQIDLTTPFVPYVGGGIHIGRHKNDFSSDSETQVGGNGLVGIRYTGMNSRMTPFLEFKYGPGGSGLAIFSAGILF